MTQPTTTAADAVRDLVLGYVEATAEIAGADEELVRQTLDRYDEHELLDLMQRLDRIRHLAVDTRYYQRHPELTRPVPPALRDTDPQRTPRGWQGGDH